GWRNCPGFADDPGTRVVHIAGDGVRIVWKKLNSCAAEAAVQTPVPRAPDRQPVILGDLIVNLPNVRVVVIARRRNEVIARGVETVPDRAVVWRRVPAVLKETQ